MEKKGGNMSENIGYIIAPMGLSERQMLIYQKLYEKCNFQDMTVQYTIDQLSCDIKIVDIPAKTIYKNIQIMIKKGYLEVVKKASKGNAPIYKIIKITELMGEPKVSQGRAKGEPKFNNIEGLSSDMKNQRRTKGEPKGNPIKEKEKENNIYSLVIDYLNTKTGSKYRSNTKVTKSLIDARLNDGFKLEDFYKVIDIKTKEWLNDSKWNKYLRPQTLFGTKFESYLNQKDLSKKPKQDTNSLDYIF